MRQRARRGKGHNGPFHQNSTGLCFFSCSFAVAECTFHRQHSARSPGLVIHCARAMDGNPEPQALCPLHMKRRRGGHQCVAVVGTFAFRSVQRVVLFPGHKSTGAATGITSPPTHPRALVHDHGLARCNGKVRVRLLSWGSALNRGHCYAPQVPEAGNHSLLPQKPKPTIRRKKNTIQ